LEQLLGMLEEKLVEAQAKVKKRIQELIFPLLVFMVGAFAVLFFGIWQSVNQLDRSEIKASETLFYAILLNQREQLRSLVVDSSFWDAAVANLVLDFNGRWAENNVGAYLHDAHTLSGTYVVGDTNQTIYSVQDSEVTNVGLLESFPGVEDFLELVRLSHRDGTADTGLTEIRAGQNGKLFFIAAAVINADFTQFEKVDEEALQQSRHVLLLTKTLDQLYLDNISRWYPFPKIKFEKMPVEISDGTSSWDFISIDGVAIGWATWQMPLSGHEVLASTLKTISISLVGLLILIVHIVYRGMDLNRIASQGIVDFSEAKKITENYERAISDLGQRGAFYELSVDVAFKKIAINATKTMQIDLVSLWQIGEDKTSLHNLYCFNTIQGDLATTKKIALSDYPEMIDENSVPKILCTSNIWEEPSLLNFAETCFDTKEPLSFLAVPVIRHQKVTGLVCFANYDVNFDWTEDRRRFASSIGTFISIIFEVQAQKLIETELRDEKNKAEAANVAKNDFLANMSHELRTPLNAIIGFSDLISQEIYGKLGSDQYQEYIADINTSGLHLLSLINEILDVSKTQSGTYVVYPEDVDVETELENVIRLLRGRFAEKEFEIDVNVENGSERIYVDPKSFRQIIINVLSNAIKFCEAKSQISIHIVQKERNTQICIKDNGIGIPEDKLSEIFTPFVQVENIMSKKFEGTGLGLSITRALVELHHGKISIHSDVGLGTTVTIEIPVE